MISLYCRDENILTLLLKLNSNKLHGALVVDTENKPKGFVSSLDIIVDLLRHAEVTGKTTSNNIKKIKQEGERFTHHKCKDLLSKRWHIVTQASATNAPVGANLHQLGHWWHLHTFHNYLQICLDEIR